MTTTVDRFATSTSSARRRRRDDDSRRGDGPHRRTIARGAFSISLVIVGLERTFLPVGSGLTVSTNDEPDDDADFRALFYAHFRAVSAYVGSHHPGADVDDVVSETFAVAW